MNRKTRICKVFILISIIYTYMISYATAYDPYYGGEEEVERLHEVDTDKISEELRNLPPNWSSSPMGSSFPGSGSSSGNYASENKPTDNTTIFGEYGSKNDLFELGIYQRGADFLVSKVIPDIVSKYPIKRTAKDNEEDGDDDIVVADEYCFDYKLTISNLIYNVPFDEDTLTLELEKGEVSGYLSSPDATVSGDISFEIKNHAALDWDHWYCFFIPEFNITLPFDIKGIFVDVILSLEKAGNGIAIDEIKDIDIDVTKLDIDGGFIEEAVEAVLLAIEDISELINETFDSDIADIYTDLDEYVFDSAKKDIEKGVKSPMKEAVNQSLVEAFELYSSSSAYDIDEYGLTFDLNPSDLTLINGKMGLAFDGEISPVNDINSVTSDPSGFGVTDADRARDNSYAYVSFSQLFMNEVMDSYYRGDLLKYSGSAVFDELFNLDYEISLGSAPKVHLSESKGITVSMTSVSEAVEIYYSSKREPIATANITFDLDITLVPKISGNAITIDVSDVTISNISVPSELSTFGMTDEDISNFITDSVTEFADQTISGKTISQSFFVGDYELEIEEIENGDYYTTIYLLFDDKSNASASSSSKARSVNVETGKINYFDIGDNKLALMSALSSIKNENSLSQTLETTTVNRVEEAQVMPLNKTVESSPKQKETAIKKGKSKNKFVNSFLSKSKKIFNRMKFSH